MPIFTIVCSKDKDHQWDPSNSSIERIISYDEMKRTVLNDKCSVCGANLKRIMEPCNYKFHCSGSTRPSIGGYLSDKKRAEVEKASLDAEFTDD
jgi:hypothetical protein